MRPDSKLLPAALRPVAETTGLEYLPFLQAGIVPYPVACKALPIFKEPGDVDRLPVQMNFHATCLDLDRKEDREEYERVMTYLASGYGMRLVNRDRIFITKVYRVRKEGDGQKETRRIRRKTCRVYLEYYAPYRVLPSGNEEEKEP